MDHNEKLLIAAQILNDMARDVPSHPLLEISAEAMAHRAAKEALLAKAHELRKLALDSMI